MKKIMTILLAVMLVSCCLAPFHSEGGSNAELTTAPKMAAANTESKRMSIGGYFAPKVSDEQFKLIADSGINIFNFDAWSSIKDRTPNGDYVYVDGVLQSKSPKLDSELLLYALSLGEKHNVDLLLPLSNSYKTADTDLRGVDTVLTDYSGYSAFKGFDVVDEPNINQFDWIADQLTIFKEKYSDEKMFFVNLLNNKAGTSALGTKDYNQYISEFCEKVLKNLPEQNRVLSFDFYPLYNDVKNVHTTFLHPMYISNLATIANAAKQYQASMTGYIQTLAYATDHRYATEADLRLQVNLHMAFGAKGVNYFSYQSANGDAWLHGTAMLDIKGYPTATYYSVQKVNKEILSFDEIFLEYNWDNFIKSNGTKETEKGLANLIGGVGSYGNLTSVKSEYDAVVGCFKNAADQSSYYVVNYTDPLHGHKNIIKLDFGSTKKITVYKYGIAQEIELVDGIYSCRLDEGEGQFIVPMN